MRQENAYYTLLKGGRSFGYRDIFSGLSNEKMSPVPSIVLSLIDLKHYTFFYVLAHYLSTPSAFFKTPATNPPLGIDGIPWYPSVAGLAPALCRYSILLNGAGLVLLKTNFIKKPKNPV
jgi:hypothetical protein